MTRFGSIAILAALTLAGCHKTKLDSPPLPGPPQLVWNVTTETTPVKSFTAQTYTPDTTGDFNPPPAKVNIVPDLINLLQPVYPELTRWRVVLHAKHDGGVQVIRIKGGSVKYVCDFAKGYPAVTKTMDLPPSTVTFKPQNGEVPTDPFLPYDLLFNEPGTNLSCPAQYTLRSNATYDLVGQATDFAGHSTTQHLVVTVIGPK